MLALEALVANQSFGATAYHWDFGDGTTSTEAAPVHTFVNDTPEDATYVIQLVATSALGCTDTTAVGVVVHPMPEATSSPPRTTRSSRTLPSP